MSEGKTAKRLLIVPHGTGKNDVNTVYTYQLDALLDSHSHWRLRNGSWSGGGPFLVYKKHRVGTFYKIRNWYLNGAEWSGTVGSPGLSSLPPTFTYPNVDNVYADLAADYATGFKRARPGNPVADAGQFLVELRDLPHVPLKMFKKLNFFRALGSEYLNVVFGWKPFVNDLKKMYNLWQDIDKRMAQLIHENGRSLHRRATIENSTSVSGSSQTTTLGPFLQCTGAPGTSYTSGGYTRVDTTTVTTTRKWFVGRFQYYIPDIGSSQWDRRARAALFGVLPTPSLLWEVLPWSWLIDWFSNVGDVISNASTNAVDNLTCKYSFCMAHTKTATEIAAISRWNGKQAGGPMFTNTPSGSITLQTTNIEEMKVRVGGGNPYGLNVKLADLSAYQLSILAALGISRGRVK